MQAEPSHGRSFKSGIKSGVKLRAILSVFIAFQLIAVALAPNLQSFPQKSVREFFGAYLVFFEFVCPWRFFAPDPGPPPLFVEWELLGKDGKSIKTGRYPDLSEDYFFTERRLRRMASARFMIESDGRAQKMLGDYLCRENPTANSIRLWSVVYPTPLLEEFASGKAKIIDENKLDRHVLNMSFCEGRS